MRKHGTDSLVCMIQCAEVQSILTYVVDKSDTLHMHVLPVKCILQEFNYIPTDGILGSEALRPCEGVTDVRRLLPRLTC